MLRDLIAMLKRPYKNELAQFRAAAGVQKTTVVTASIDLPSIPALTVGYIDVTVAGAKTSNAVSLSLAGDLPANILISGVKVQGANTVRVYGYNTHAENATNAAAVSGRFVLFGE